ncbi:MAG: hypothetical protein PVH84_09275 [Candidatus Aminicenantes bacterium]|jgi:hypothetical protein
MFCAIYKWFISSAQDSRKPIPTFLNRHIQRCESCREFAELHESLTETSIKDLPCIDDDKKSVLASSIISALDNERETVKPPDRRTSLIPVFVSSFVLLAVAAGIYFLTSPRPNSSHFFNSLSAIDNTISSFEERLDKVNSPLQTEYEDLKQTMKSTTEFFASYLDVKIGQGTE